MNKFSLAVLIFILNFSCSAQNEGHDVGVMFYNLENLYDTINDPNKDDEVFLPGADRNWNTERYTTKLENMSKVIAMGAGIMPVLVGLCEVENEQVIKDLVNEENLKEGNYAYVHFDSPDERGIDVALLYNKKKFSVKKSFPIKVNLPSDSGDLTRDILFVYGEIEINGKREPLNIFVNHWPSRVEGEEVSAPKRMAAAQTLKHIIDSLYKKLTYPNIIIMGDFNDTPFDKSIQQGLNAQEIDAAIEGSTLTDLMASKQKSGEGSYNYKGLWQALDHIIVSNSLLDNKNLEVARNSTIFVKQDWMMFHHDKYGESPNRTYSGTRYIGGYSDHLPVFVELIIK